MKASPHLSHRLITTVLESRSGRNIDSDFPFLSSFLKFPLSNLRLILGGVTSAEEGREAQPQPSPSPLVQCQRVTRGPVAQPWNP